MQSTRSPLAVLITGSPATGKSTLAAHLAQTFALPLLAKDAIKEALFDTLGDAALTDSRRLSDASFAVLFRLARLSVDASASVLLEGNFRPTEHLAPLRESLRGARILQIACSASEATRATRLAARRHDAERHPLHADAALIGGAVALGAMDLDGERLMYDSERGTTERDALVARVATWLAAQRAPAVAATTR
jgi:predicted kinase